MIPGNRTGNILFREGGSSEVNKYADSADQLRKVFRLFKRYASRLRDGIDSLGESASLRFSMSLNKGEAVKSSFDEGQPLVRFAALLRPFMISSSPIDLRAVWKTLSEDARLAGNVTCEKITNFFDAAEHLDVTVVLNGKKLTARDLYFAYAEGEFFDENVDAKELLEQLSFGPMRQMALFLFYSACESYSKLVFAILDVILDMERRFPELTIPRGPEPQCIFCLTRDGDFYPEEHIIPEAFGLDELVLRDAVCQTCNNKFSKLDQFLADFEPLALLRVQNVPLTKKGKFPRAEFQDFVLEKVKPRALQFTSKTKKDVFVKGDLPDGSFRLSLNMTSRKRVDMLRLARALFKIGVGLVAYDRGVEYACDSRFDAARGFIHGERTMPNHLLILRNVNPSPSISTFWQSFDAATVVELDVFGVGFGFNLEPSPFEIPDEAPSDVFQALWLGEETKGGAISPCGAKCTHPDVRATIQ